MMRTLRKMIVAVGLVTSLLLWATAALADDTVCQGTLGAVTVDNVIVPNRSKCTLNGTRVQGNVKVLTGATLTANRVRVEGNIQAEGAQSVVVKDSSYVDGSIQIKQGGGAIIDRVNIREDLQFDENRSALKATRNRVDGNLQAVANTSGLFIADNVIAQSLQRKENNPPPTGGNNIAGDKEGQCEGL